MENIFWEGYSNEERHSTLNTIKDLVSRYGDIVNVHLFSDLSINLEIEMEELNIDFLFDELNKIISMQKHHYLNSRSARERKVYFNITFSQGTGNLIIEVPAVPG